MQLDDDACREAILEAREALHANKLKTAAKMFSDIIATNPDAVDAWRGLGVASLKGSRVEEAKALLEVALKKAPRNPMCMYDYSLALGMMGDFNKAVKMLRKSLKAKPDFANAYYALSSNVKFKNDIDLKKIEEILANGVDDRNDLVAYHFAAGKMCDDLKRYDRAFYHYSKGNEATGKIYNRSLDYAFMQAARGVFSREFVTQFEGDSDLGEGQVFIIGMPRSGTTLLEELLSRHSQIFGAGELNDIEGIIAMMQKRQEHDNNYPGILLDKDAAYFREFGQWYCDKVSKLSNGSPVVINKHPLNFRHVGFIRMMMPKAKFIHCKRHPLDICLSCYMQNFANGQDYSFSLDDLAFFFQIYRSIMAVWNNRLPENILDVYYEDVVNDQEAALHSVIRFLGLEWEEACLSEESSGRPIRTASSWQARQSIYTGSLGKAAHYREHLAELETAIAPSIEGFEQEYRLSKSAA